MSYKSARMLAGKRASASVFMYPGTGTSRVMPTRNSMMTFIADNWRSSYRAMVRLWKFGLTAQGRKAANMTGPVSWISLKVSAWRHGV